LRQVPLPDPVQALATGNSVARAVALYPSSAGANAGKIVVAGDLTTSNGTSTVSRFAVVRLDPDGSLDNGFGTQGYVLLAPGATNGFDVVSVAIDSQGRIVVAALAFQTNCDEVVMRVTAAGVTDPAFATYNSVAPGGYCGIAQAMAVIGGDKIVVLGQWNNPD